MITGDQIRAARGLLDLGQLELAEIADIGISTINGSSLIRDAWLSSTLWKIQAALEKAGVEFLSEDELKGHGVRLNRSRRR